MRAATGSPMYVQLVWIGPLRGFFGRTVWRLPAQTVLVRVSFVFVAAACHAHALVGVMTSRRSGTNSRLADALKPLPAAIAGHSAALQCSLHALTCYTHSSPATQIPVACVVPPYSSVSGVQTCFLGDRRHPSHLLRNHRFLVRAGQEVVGAMAGQQQQIIDTIFSMKRKLLRGNDCTYQPAPCSACA